MAKDDDAARRQQEQARKQQEEARKLNSVLDHHRIGEDQT